MENDNNIEVLTKIISALGELDKDAQKRTLMAVVTYLDIQLGQKEHQHKTTSSDSHIENKSGVSFTENRDISAKAFMREKSPKTDIERITCLAYYLTHYRDTPHFKTLDLSTLNTEAAQPKFSNSTLAVNNAATAGLLVAAGSGKKQITAVGEIFVQALPDREAAKASITSMVKRRVKKNSSKNLKNKA